jgi:cell division septation protein DedD
MHDSVRIIIMRNKSNSFLPPLLDTLPPRQRQPATPIHRGDHEPSGELRVIDGAEDDDDVKVSRLPPLTVPALLLLAMFAGVVWLAYTQGVARGRTETPVLTAEYGPARIAPQNPLGAEQPYNGFKIYRQPMQPSDNANSNSSAVIAVPAPAKSTPRAEPAPVATGAPVPQSIILRPSVSEAPTTPSTSKVAAAAPAPATVKPASVSAMPTSISPASIAAPKSSGAFVLQIGSYKSQEQAEVALKVYKAKHADLVASSGDEIQRVNLGGMGIWYRLHITGFRDEVAASAMCSLLKADGGSCILGK